LQLKNICSQHFKKNANIIENWGNRQLVVNAHKSIQHVGSDFTTKVIRNLWHFEICAILKIMGRHKLVANILCVLTLKNSHTVIT
jgi:hypothetical protein